MEKKYSSKIIKALALVDDTKILLSVWDTDEYVEDNLNRIKEANLLDKRSRSQIEMMLPRLGERYLFDSDVAGALSHLVNQQFYPGYQNIHNLYACVQPPIVRSVL